MRLPWINKNELIHFCVYDVNCSCGKHLKMRPETASNEKKLNIFSQRERNKRDKQNRIIGAARALFQSQGYQQTTMAQIAAAADVATGTLFLYAKSKEDLVILVFLDEMYDVVESSFAARDTGSSALTGILTFLRGIIEYHAADMDIARALMKELTFLSNPERSSDVSQIAVTIVRRIREILEQAISEEEVQLDEPHQVAEMMFSMYFQQQQAWLANLSSRERLEENLSSMLGYLLR